ncbi:hypothetical protein AALO_G00040840 [Alosa alosa]|uniref:Uncharacterized protein n=1 Tax=Alosa alosa TaxID=278164 RepID=A0AAV6HBE5_9TELE|nr:hypothetical protein AALO_G00040840 [Alosa alosa]
MSEHKDTEGRLERHMLPKGPLYLHHHRTGREGRRAKQLIGNLQLSHSPPRVIPQVALGLGSRDRSPYTGLSDWPRCGRLLQVDMNSLRLKELSNSDLYRRRQERPDSYAGSLAPERLR